MGAGWGVPLGSMEGSRTLAGGVGTLAVGASGGRLSGVGPSRHGFPALRTPSGLASLYPCISPRGRTGVTAPFLR